MKAISMKALEVLVGGTRLIEPFDYELDYNCCLWVNGESGCGKSSLLRALVGLMDHGGQALNDEQKPLSCSRSFVHYIAQYPDNFNGRVDEYLQRPWGWRVYQQKKRSQQTVSELLAQLNLPESILKLSFAELSGGQRKRLQLLCSLQLGPKILLLDEPFAGLDEKSQAKVLAVLQDFLKKPTKALVIASHETFSLSPMVVGKIADKKLTFH